jgi:phage gpG-like protein
MDYQIKFNTKNFDQKFNQVLQKYPQELQRICSRSMTILEAEVIENLNNKVLRVITGRLKSSVRVFFDDRIGNLYKTVLVVGGGQRVKYARIHEYGGVIRPRRKPFLFFRVGGQWIRTLKVVMPARPFVKPAIEKRKDDMYQYIAKNIIKLTKGGD